MDLLGELNSALAGRYRIEREIGRGGMATVYLARDVRHDRAVAFKVLDPDLAASAGVDRFSREIDLTAKLTHPHILPLLDSGRVGEVSFYVMPLITGETLRERLQRSGELAVDDAVRLACEVAGALEYAHRSGIVHRDIKPENILLQDGQAVVADFGVARTAGAGPTLRTGTGISVGTPSYMSPEQANAERTIDGRTDVYALGCVLHEMLVGTPPFTAASAQALMARHANDLPPSIRSVRPTVPQALERVVQRALAKGPADRFQTADEMRTAMMRAVSDQRPSRMPSRNVALFAAIAAIAVVVVVGVVGTRKVLTRTSAPIVVQEVLAPSDSTRIAVLPMANLSPDSADSYFAAGMTDELISTLSDIGGLHVIARSAIIRYAGSTMPVTEIARELGVGSVIESTCRKDGRRLRIGIRLVDARTQEQRWSRQYDRELTDAFAIQHDVAVRVADALRVRLRPLESSVLNQLPTASPAAVEAYMQGKMIGYGRATPVALEIDSGIALLERAVQLDRNFAVAHATLGALYLEKLFNFAPGPKYRVLAEREIARALALDSTVAEAYDARGGLAYTPEGGWRLEDALRDHLHAVVLKPSLARARARLGILLMHVGILEPALRELRTSIALDPFDNSSRLRLPRTLWYSQKYDSALMLFVRGPDIRAEHALVLGYLDRTAEGLAFLDSASRRGLSNDAGDVHAARAVLLARLGRRAEAERELVLGASIGAGLAHFHHAEFSLAVANALLGKHSEAVKWLTAAANGGMPAYELFANDPALVVLHDDPGYRALMLTVRRRYDGLRAILSAADFPAISRLRE